MKFTQTNRAIRDGLGRWEECVDKQTYMNHTFPFLTVSIILLTALFSKREYNVCVISLLLLLSTCIGSLYILPSK